MSNELSKWPAGPMNKGVDVFDRDFHPELGFSFDTYNVTSGVYLGVGPRYGMAPMPWHSTAAARVSPAAPGFLEAETNTSRRRRRLFKIWALRMYSLDADAQATLYAVLYSREDATRGYHVDVAMLGTDAEAGSGSIILSADIRSGIHLPTLWDGKASNEYERIGYEAVPAGFAAIDKLYNAINNAAISSTRTFVSSCLFSASGRDVPMQWMVGEATGTASAVRAPNIIGWYEQNNTFFCGLPSEWMRQDYSKALRTGVKVYSMAASGDRIAEHRLNQFAPSSTYFVRRKYLVASASHDFSSLAATLTAGPFAPYAYADIDMALIQDPAVKTNSAYKAILVANDAPTAFVIQDWLTDRLGALPQAVDMCELPYEPPTLNTQGGFSEASCLNSWPTYTAGTKMAADLTLGIALGSTSRGILRANTSYEFTYSVYNKRLNFETNVGKPVKFFTSTTEDFTDIGIWHFAGGGYDTPFRAMGSAGNPSLLPFRSDGIDYHYLNYMEYRFYYRQLGSYEWLPAGNFDAALFWFWPMALGNEGIRLCTGPIAGLPGGQPGGFTDYSRLPKDKYNCVVTYRNRAFWISDRSIVFSATDNIFAYPTGNSLGASTGEWRGALVHNYPGQANQSSRLIVFSSDQIYVGRFTGIKQQRSVQVSPDSSGVFDVDGSDFVLDPWTSVTAFSHRSAIVADGILYYWGPQGIYEDLGNETPGKISDFLETDLFELYDTGAVKDIFASYNEQTKEITWYYTPKTSDGVHATYGLVYNRRSKTFLPVRYVAKLEDSYKLDIQTASDKLGGQRSMVNASESGGTISRTYFHDQRARGLDAYPKRDFMIASWTTPVAGQRTLQLATGFVAAQVATIVANDYITIPKGLEYATSDTNEDVICKVVSLNSVAGTIVVTIPSTATVSAAVTLTQAQYIPCYHTAAAGQGLNGIAWKWQADYWAPGGVNYFGVWQYLYLQMQMTYWKSVDAQTVNVSYRTPTAAAVQTDAVTLEDNSDGNQQVYHPLVPGEDAALGQAIKVSMSGVHRGSAWVLQYMEAHTVDVEGNPLKEFEG